VHQSGHTRAAQERRGRCRQRPARRRPPSAGQDGKDARAHHPSVGAAAGRSSNRVTRPVIADATGCQEHRKGTAQFPHDRDTTPGISGNGLVELWRLHCHAVRNLSPESRLKRLESENQDRPLAIGGKRILPRRHHSPGVGGLQSGILWFGHECRESLGTRGVPPGAGPRPARHGVGAQRIVRPLDRPVRAVRGPRESGRSRETAPMSFGQEEVVR
jgi:hypothetical protein